MKQIIQISALVDDQKIGWFNVNLLFWSFLAMFADGYDITAMSFAAPQLVKLWHINAAMMGPVFSASLFGVLAGAPLLGYAGDRFGRKTAIILGSVIFGVATLAMTQASNLDQMLVLRFVTGIGLGGLMPNTIALNAELSPRRWRSTLIILMFMGITLGSSAPGALAVWLLPHYGWRVLFLVGGALPLLVAFFLVFALPESVKFLVLHPARREALLKIAWRLRPQIADDAEFTGEAAEPASGTGLREIFAPGFAAMTLLLWVCFVIGLMVTYFLNSWMPLLFGAGGFTANQAAMASALYQIGGTLGGLAVSLLLDRYGFITVAILLALAGPAVVAMGHPGISYPMLSLFVAMAGFCVVGAQFGANAASGLVYPTAFRSKGVGWAFAIGRFGSIAGPLMGGALIARHLPLSELFLFPAIPLALAAVAAVLFARICYKRFGGFRLGDAPAIMKD